MATVVKLQQILHKLVENWSRGTPEDVYLGAGELAKALEKDSSSDWNGDDTIKVPVNSQINSMAGPNYGEVFANSGVATGEQFDVKASQLMISLQLDWRFLSMTRNPSAIRERVQGLQDQMLRAAQGWSKVGSYTWWGDGSGRIAKGDGAYTITGSTITLKNKACARRFEVSDVIVLAPAKTGAARTGQLTITAIDEDTGKLTTDAADISAAISGALNTDYLVKITDIGGDDPPMHGVFSWCPLTATEAATSFLGVTRSKHVNRLAGRRVALTGSESPWDIVTSMGIAMRNAGQPIDSIYVPTAEVARLSSEAKSRGVVFQEMSRPGSAQMYSVGVNGYKAIIDGVGPVGIISDPYLADIEVSEADDKTYFGCRMDDLYVATDAYGLSWRDHTGSGPLTQIVGEQTVVANYGCYGNLIQRNTAAQVVSSTRANA